MAKKLSSNRIEGNKKNKICKLESDLIKELENSLIFIRNKKNIA